MIDNNFGYVFNSLWPTMCYGNQFWSSLCLVRIYLDVLDKPFREHNIAKPPLDYKPKDISLSEMTKTCVVLPATIWD